MPQDTEALQGRVMAADQRKMGDFFRPMIGDTGSAIVLSTAAREYELKSIQFKLLPSFHGEPNEDSLNFMREFCLAVQSFPLKGLAEDELKMKFFPYTLKDRAKSWLLLQQPNSLENWDAIYDRFMIKYFPYCKTQELRMQIIEFAQMLDEPFHDAWDRFKSLQQQCPHHHFSQELLYQTFYDGLDLNFQYMVDIVAKGDIGKCTAQDLSNIFENLASSSQSKGAKGCRVEMSRNYGDLEHGEKVWQPETDLTYKDRVRVNAVYDLQLQNFDHLQQGCNLGWRSNPTFVWQPHDDMEAPLQPAQALAVSILKYDEIDDEEDESTWPEKDDACELEQPTDDESQASLEEVQAVMFFKSGEVDKEEEPTDSFENLDNKKLSLSMFKHYSYVIASDAFFAHVSLQDDDLKIGEAKPVLVVKSGLKDNSTHEYKTSAFPSFPLILGPADVREEDELVQLMEWFKLESEFG